MKFLYKEYVCVVLVVTKMMSSHTADEFDEEGLTQEEMELAQEMLREKLAEAEKGIVKSTT